mmetsp:Transcript_36391/g.49230  ORF Transcript_36391/g.49230 Transcript_36391/m.49230 type:complete len:202 (-) Transcript_36391:471-1076(-)
MTSRHECSMKRPWGRKKSSGDSAGVVREEQSGGYFRDQGNTVSSGERFDFKLFVALDVGKVFRNSDDACIHGHEACQEGHGWIPYKTQPQCFSRCVVHTEVEKEPSADCDAQPSCDREPLQAEGRDRVKPSDGGAKHVQPEYHLREEMVDDQRTTDGAGDYEGPSSSSAELPCGDWKEGLIDFIDVNVVDLVDTHDERVAE